MKWKLLGTSPSILGIEKIIRRFWVSDFYGIDSSTLQITHPSKDMNETARVVNKGGRYRFEMKY